MHGREKRGVPQKQHQQVRLSASSEVKSLSPYVSRDDLTKYDSGASTVILNLQSRHYVVRMEAVDDLINFFAQYCVTDSLQEALDDIIGYCSYVLRNLVSQATDVTKGSATATSGDVAEMIASNIDMFLREPDHRIEVMNALRLSRLIIISGCAVELVEELQAHATVLDSVVKALAPSLIVGQKKKHMSNRSGSLDSNASSDWGDDAGEDEESTNVVYEVTCGVLGSLAALIAFSDHPPHLDDDVSIEDRIVGIIDAGATALLGGNTASSPSTTGRQARGMVRSHQVIVTSAAISVAVFCLSVDALDKIAALLESVIVEVATVKADTPLDMQLLCCAAADCLVALCEERADDDDELVYQPDGDAIVDALKSFTHASVKKHGRKMKKDVMASMDAAVAYFTDETRVEETVAARSETVSVSGVKLVRLVGFLRDSLADGLLAHLVSNMTVRHSLGVDHDVKSLVKLSKEEKKQQLHSQNQGAKTRDRRRSKDRDMKVVHSSGKLDEM